MVSRPSINPKTNIKMEVCGKVKTLFFVDKGSAKLEAIFNKDTFNVGETAVVECLVDNTNCEKNIKCVKLKFRRLMKAKVSHCIEYTKDETIIKREFAGMHKGKSGTMTLDMPIQMTKDIERFIQSLPHGCLNHPQPDLDVLKLLACPTAQGTLIECLYFLEVHVYYSGLTTDKLKAVALPILVCRPITYAQIPIPVSMLIPL